MKSQTSILAILAAGVSADYAPPTYGTTASSEPVPTYAAGCPPVGTNKGNVYYCNVGHSYPAGQTCQADEHGCYVLVQTSSTSAPGPAPTYPAPAPFHGDACATACKEKWDKCRVTPANGASSGSANMAQCGSEYASCIGFNPFTQTGSVFATPTACSSTSSAPPTTTTSCSTTATTTPPATTSAPPPYHGDTCATSCKEKWDKCRVTPANGASSGSANFAQCASEYASCLGFNPFTQSGSSFSTPTACASTTVPPSTSTSCSTTSTATPSTTAVPPPNYDSCAADCKAKWDKCRVTPANGASSGSANQAQCSAEYAACIGFNPFTQGGSSFSTPTACSKTSSVPSSTSCSTTATAPPPQPTQYDSCAADCKAKWDKCRVTPANGASSGSANQAQCSAEYAACIGFNPFTQSGTFTTPTACHKTVQPSSTSCSTTSTVTHAPPQPTPAGDECAQKCTTEYRKCQTTRQADGSSANQSLCASNYAACLNYNPFPVSAGQSFVQPTACAPKTTQAPPPPATTPAPAPPAPSPAPPAPAPPAPAPPSPAPAPPAPAPPAPAPPSPAPAPPAPAPPAPAPPSPAPAPPAPAPPAPAPPSPAPAPPSTTTPPVPQSTNAATQKGASIFAAVAMAAAALAL